MLAEQLTSRQQVVAIVLAIGMLLTVLELVRRRKLREEYAALWIVTAIALTVLSLWTSVLGWFMLAIDAVTPASTLFFGSLLFLILLSLQFSIRLTKLTHRNRLLTQKVSLLEREIRDLQQSMRDAADPEIERAVHDLSESISQEFGQRNKPLPRTGTDDQS